MFTESMIKPLEDFGTDKSRELKRARDRKYYASYRGRVNRWRKGALDARDDKLRALARHYGYSVTFIDVDNVVLRETLFKGNVQDAIDWFNAC